MDAMKLGKIGLTLGGDYDSAKEYDKLVCVTHEGRSWVSRKEVPSGMVPSFDNVEYWQLVSERGEQGEQGERGLMGLSGPRGLQGNSGYSGAADELEVVNNLETDDATAALSAKMGKELGEELAQLSQEFEELKEAEFTVNVEVLPHIEKVVVTDGAAILEPDKLYDFGESAQIAIAFAPASEPQYAAQYAFQFKSPADTPTTLTMPDGVVFPKESDSILSIKAGLTYQITIVENLAVATSWEV